MIARADAERAQRVGEAVGERAQVGEGVRAALGPGGDARAAALLNVAIDDVARDVEFVGNFEIAADATRLGLLELALGSLDMKIPSRGLGTCAGRYSHPFRRLRYVDRTIFVNETAGRPPEFEAAARDGRISHSSLFQGLNR